MSEAEDAIMNTARSRSHPVYRQLTLDTNQDSIRLLTILPGAANGNIRCWLNVVQLTADIHYEAISYTWGSDDELHQININDENHQFSVRPNLLDLLVSIRNEQIPKVVWIDAICIDQGNLAERNRQVGMMREIYSMAQQVVVWLGRPTHPKLLPAIYYINSFSGEVEDRTLPEFVRESVLEISRNAYWTRVWILQEVISARQITVLVSGIAGFVWWRLEWAINSVFNTQQNVQNADLAADETYHLRRLIQHRHQFQKRGTISLEEALYRYEDCKSTDFRDRIFGLLGIVQGQGLTVDYNVSRKDLFIQTLSFCQSSNPVRLGVMLRRAFKLNVGSLQPEQNHEALPQGVWTSMPQHMMSACLSFYGVLAECLQISQDNHHAEPTLWLCDPDEPIKRGYRGTLMHDMAMGLWGLRHFDDEYWLRKSAQEFEVNAIMRRCYPDAAMRHNPFRIGGRRSCKVAHSSELGESIRSSHSFTESAETDPLGDHGAIRRGDCPTPLIYEYQSGVDPTVEHCCALDIELPTARLVYDFEGTDLAIIVTPTGLSAEQGTIGEVISRQTNLHIVEWRGAFIGPPDLLMLNLNWENAPDTIQVMLTWSMLGRLVEMAESHVFETVSCCETHFRPSTASCTKAG